MDSKDENMELINEAIKRLLEESKNRDASADDDDDCLLLSRLLSQVSKSPISTLSLSLSLIKPCMYVNKGTILPISFSFL